MIPHGSLCWHFFLRIILWERFKTLGPKLVEFEVVNMVDVEKEYENVNTVPGRPLKMRA